MKIGDKVVCINDDFRNIVDFDFTVFEDLPQKGKKYIIRRKENWDGGTRVLLEEVKNPPLKKGLMKGVEPGFSGDRFRKLVDDLVLEKEEEEEEIND